MCVGIVAVDNLLRVTPQCMLQQFSLNVLHQLPLPLLLYFTTCAEGVPYPRKEIRDLGGPERDLHFLAWAAYCGRSPADPTSHYQVAGIHGLPFAPYDGVRWRIPDSEHGDVTDEQYGGYCLHNTQLFLPWHRPYVMLVEQVGAPVQIVHAYASR